MSNANTNSSAAADDAALQRVQRLLDYQFLDTALLRQALTHKSYAKQHNERLEFLGDSVLGYLVAELLFEADPQWRENVLSLMRSSLVRGSALAELARELDIAPSLLLGSGERKSGGRNRDSILADAMEAIIGAIHQDGGIEPCRRLVRGWFSDLVAHLDPQALKDAKTQLQERLQGEGIGLPSYEVVQVEGADHQRSYTVSCGVSELGLVTEATGSSRRGAEQDAAAAMLDTLREKL